MTMIDVLQNLEKDIDNVSEPFIIEILTHFCEKLEDIKQSYPNMTKEEMTKSYNTIHLGFKKFKSFYLKVDSCTWISNDVKDMLNNTLLKIITLKKEILSNIEGNLVEISICSTQHYVSKSIQKK